LRLLQRRAPARARAAYLRSANAQTGGVLWAAMSRSA